MIPLSFLYIFSWFETNLDHRPFSCVALVVEPVVHLGILEWRDFLSEIQIAYPDLNLLKLSLQKSKHRKCILNLWKPVCADALRGFLD